MKRFANNRIVARQSDRGTSALEVIVAFTMLSSVLAFSTPLVVRHSRLLTAQRDYRLALDELSNQLERLSALPAAELPAAVERLAPSEFAAARLHGAELKVELSPADIGQRLTLRLSWDEPQRREAPLTLAAWIIPRSEPSSNPPTRNQQP